MMHMIEEAFGKGCDLYQEVLQCPNNADKATLRKAYYRASLRSHPDKNPGDTAAAATFQAVTAAYQILQDPDLRAAYDESGVIPDMDPDDFGGDTAASGSDHWKAYFQSIFGRVSTGGIEAFAAKYKCSDEERRDVIKEYKARKGNLVKMLEFVLLSEARDASRWVEDYIRPAMESGEIDTSYTETMEKTLKKLQKQVEKGDHEEFHTEEEAFGDDEDDETETESEGDDDMENRRKRLRNAAAAKTKKSVSPRKAKSTVAKKKKKDDTSDLIAQIQNKKRGGTNALASLGARYGVSMDDADPLNDKQFEKIQSKLKNNKKKR